jgi:hypothetical protein
MIPFLNNCIRKSSSQVFIDTSCNILELDEKIPKEVIDHYVKNNALKEQDKYKNRIFYKMQDKIRNMKPLDDADFLRLYTFDEDEKILLLQIANNTIAILLEHLNL